MNTIEVVIDMERRQIIYQRLNERPKAAKLEFFLFKSL